MPSADVPACWAMGDARLAFQQPGREMAWHSALDRKAVVGGWTSLLGSIWLPACLVSWWEKGGELIQDSCFLPASPSFPMLAIPGKPCRGIARNPGSAGSRARLPAKVGVPGIQPLASVTPFCGLAAPGWQGTAPLNASSGRHGARPSAPRRQRFNGDDWR